MCESRPLCEGVQLAAAWAEAGIECTIITDAQVLASAGWQAGRQGLPACTVCLLTSSCSCCWDVNVHLPGWTLSCQLVSKPPAI